VVLCGTRRVHVVSRRRRRPGIVAGGLHERAAGAGERVQRRPQALGRPGPGGPGGARAPRTRFVVPAAVPEQRVRVLGALQEQRAGHHAVEEQRPGQHRAAVHRPGRPLPGGPDIRVAGERRVPAPVGPQPDQLRRRVDQTRVRPEHAGQVKNARARAYRFTRFRYFAALHPKRGRILIDSAARAGQLVLETSVKRG